MSNSIRDIAYMAKQRENKNHKNIKQAREINLLAPLHFIRDLKMIIDEIESSIIKIQ